MQSISLQTATEKLVAQIRDMGLDEIVEVYNELFPQSPLSEQDVAADSAAAIDRIMRHVEDGLEPEEVVALWALMFPQAEWLEYDEEDDLLRFVEKPELHSWTEY